uniref:VWA domain-containing protein n=1 Tax=Phaeobacter italicus TaxID=481446 RepID=UPI00248E042A
MPRHALVALNMTQPYLLRTGPDGTRRASWRVWVLIFVTPVLFMLAAVLSAVGVAPEQTASFLAGVGLLGPRSIGDIHAAARATLAQAPERFEAFDALFRAHFLGQSLSAPAETVDDERAFEPEDGAAHEVEAQEETRSGAEATAAEALAGRGFAELPEAEALRRFRRVAPEALPRRRSRRMRVHHAGRRPYLRQALREAVRRDGEVFSLPRLAPRTAQRRILLLIDVSGSMKGETDRSLRFAHALAH